MLRLLASLPFMLLSAAAVAGEHRYSGGIEGPAGWILGAPTYWFVARYYLDKASHLAVAGLVILAAMAFTGPLGLYSGLIGIAAGYWIYLPFTVSHKLPHKWATVGGSVLLLNVVGAIAGAIYLVGHLPKGLPTW